MGCPREVGLIVSLSLGGEPSQLARNVPVDIQNNDIVFVSVAVSRTGKRTRHPHVTPFLSVKGFLMISTVRYRYYSFQFYLNAKCRLSARRTICISRVRRGEGGREWVEKHFSISFRPSLINYRWVISPFNLVCLNKRIYDTFFLLLFSVKSLKRISYAE